MTPEIYIIVTAGGMFIAAAAMAVLAMRLLRRIDRYEAQADRQQAMLRDAAELLEQMDLLAKDMHGKLDERVRQIDEAVAKADASAARLRLQYADLAQHGRQRAARTWPPRPRPPDTPCGSRRSPNQPADSDASA